MFRFPFCSVSLSFRFVLCLFFSPSCYHVAFCSVFPSIFVFVFVLCLFSFFYYSFCCVAFCFVFRFVLFSFRFPCFLFFCFASAGFPFCSVFHFVPFPKLSFISPLFVLFSILFILFSFHFPFSFVLPIFSQDVSSPIPFSLLFRAFYSVPFLRFFFNFLISFHLLCVLYSAPFS